LTISQTFPPEQILLTIEKVMKWRRLQKENIALKGRTGKDEKGAMVKLKGFSKEPEYKPDRRLEEIRQKHGAFRRLWPTIRGDGDHHRSGGKISRH
jgi:hypothetical protein